MATLITFRYPRDDVVRSRIHTEHYKTLFLDFLIPSIAQHQSRVNGNPYLPDGSYAAWAEDELLLLGFVSCYHLWEKQLLLLISAQLQNLGLSLPQRGKQSFTSYVRGLLSKYLAAELPDTSIWQSLEKTRCIVNAYKHGPGRSFEAAIKQHPEFFHPGYLDGNSAIICVTREQFEELVATLKTFWDSLPYTVKYT